MDESRFWKIIDRVRRNEDDEPSAALEAALTRLSPEEVVSFGAHYDTRIDAADDVNLWGAAYQINGGCSDDGFHYFRVWLVSQGRKVYEAALANPDSLASVVDPDEEYEGDLDTAAARVWEEKTGRSTEEFFEEMDRIRIPASEREPGADWDFDDEEEVRRRFPRLARMYLDGEGPDGK